MLLLCIKPTVINNKVTDGLNPRVKGVAGEPPVQTVRTLNDHELMTLHVQLLFL